MDTCTHTHTHTGRQSKRRGGKRERRAKERRAGERHTIQMGHGLSETRKYPADFAEA